MIASRNRRIGAKRESDMERARRWMAATATVAIQCARNGNVEMAQLYAVDAARCYRLLKAKGGS